MHKYAIFLQNSRTAVMNALSCTEDQTLLLELLQMLTSEVALMADAPSFAGMVAANPVGKFLVWDWLDGYWEELSSQVREIEACHGDFPLPHI